MGAVVKLRNIAQNIKETTEFQVKISIPIFIRPNSSQIVQPAYSYVTVHFGNTDL